ncbi:hypothetical protein OCH7691_02288 [Oceanibacterium hippocampi]|uniref:Uncharacterized protein n=1 Tax=Oceanibacterium hippocampi TaxID=745714 RepID=A0A1Y5T4S2_9PROT|nr:hypothetical protein OCH7691_02288 [Oceanibacterium hippocampi]
MQRVDRRRPAFRPPANDNGMPAGLWLRRHRLGLLLAATVIVVGLAALIVR